VGSSLGFLFPVCECGNLPVARRLVAKGVPPHVAVAFLLAAPVFNPVVIISTWIAFNSMPELVFYRVALSFAIAVIVGWIFSFQKDAEAILHPSVWRQRQNDSQASESSASSLLQGGTFLLPSPAQTKSALQLATPTLAVQTAEDVYRSALQQSQTPQVSSSFPKISDQIDLLLETWVRELRELGSVLVMGAAIAALIQTVMPRSFLLDYGQGAVSSIGVMLGLAVIVSICSTVDSFFALAFSATFTPGSLLAFLVFGPMVDLKAIGLMMTLFKPRAIVYLILLTLQFTLIGSLAFNFYGS
jgi:hypothetical protein